MSCIEDGCDEDRYKTYPRCEDCYKRYERDRKRRQKEKKAASPSLEELYDAPIQEARERHAVRAGQEAAFQMEASIYGYQQATTQPTVWGQLSSRFMQMVGLNDTPAAPPPPPQQGQFIPISPRAGQGKFYK